MRTKVSENGLVTIPEELREKLGIKPGDVLELSVENDRLVAQKVVADSLTVIEPGGAW